MRWVAKPFVLISALAVTFLAWESAGFAQVSPAEETKPNLKRAEQAYFQQLIELNRAISRLQFPFPLVLSRYPGLDPKQQAGADKRGLEFIDFQNRVVLKISANYNAAFNGQMLTQNQRANRVVDEVVTPILQTLPKYFSLPSDFDGVGLEVSYHVRTDDKSFAYEGSEVLTVVLSKEDAFKFGEAKADQQEILDRSQVFIDGKAFGLMLGQRDAAAAEEVAAEQPSRAPAAAPPPSAPPAPQVRLPDPAQEVPAALKPPAPGAPLASATPDTRSLLTGRAPATQADADALQSKLQTQLQAFNDEGRAHDDFVDYAPPSFAVFRNQIYLQLTLRNPAVFDPNNTSIYKRAARSFDLFLAPRLKNLLTKTPQDPAITGLDITVLTKFTSNATSSAEAIEFICPIGPLRSFSDADITNQDLINQSVVLVNGVRIVLDLQQVE